MRSAIADSEYLYIEGYLVTGDSAQQAAIEAVDMARQAGTKIALSLSDPGIVEFFRAGLARNQLAMVLTSCFCNEQEALNWCETDNIDQALEHYKTPPNTLLSPAAVMALWFLMVMNI